MNQDTKESVDRLFSAAREGLVTEMKSLLSRGIRVDSQDWQGCTPVMIAVQKSKVQVVKCLISKGADPAFRADNGRNSLHCASLCGHVDVFELLVSHMTNIDSRDAMNEASLIIAAKEGRVQYWSVEELIRPHETTLDGIRYI